MSNTSHAKEQPVVDDVPITPNDEAEGEGTSPEIQARIAVLMDQVASDQAEEAAAAEEELAGMGAPAIDRMLFSLTDLRLGLQACVRIGTALGRIGDPRLTEAFVGGCFADIGAGSFTMGAAALEPEAATHAAPQHDVELQSYAIGRYPVTVQSYTAFVEAGGYEREDVWLEEGWAWRSAQSITTPHYWKSAARRPNHPVVGVCWHEAQAFCRWLTTAMREAKALRPGELIRLPTEAEWEKAARGGRFLDRRRARPNPHPKRRFPWGDAFFPNLCNSAESGINGTTPIGMYPAGASPYNVEDMTGNVLEWCSSRPNPYPYHVSDGRELETGGRTPRVARGGAWPLNGDSGSCAYRHWNKPDFRGGMIGIRLVRGHALE